MVLSLMVTDSALALALIASTMMGSDWAATSPSGEGSRSADIRGTSVFSAASAWSVEALLMMFWKGLAESAGSARMALLAASTACSGFPARMYSVIKARQPLGLVGSDWTTARKRGRD